MFGAPALCAAGALRGGAGLVKVAIKQEILPYVLAIEPCATGIVMTDDQTDNLSRLDEADPRQQAVLAIGPGLGCDHWSGQLVEALVRNRRRRVVLDADGLNLLAQQGPTDTARVRQQLASPMPWVMTPHPGEFRRLAQPLDITADPTDESSRPQAAKQLAAAYSSVVVLKGRHSLVSDGQQVYRNSTGNPALATAGSGDVLTGLIAALMAQNMTAFDAAVLGTYLHGLAGNLWKDQYGPSGMTANDLAMRLPQAFDLHRHLTV